MEKNENSSNYFNIILFYLKSDLIKRQRDFKIGLISIFLVVFFLTLLLNAIQISSCIFLSISEQQTSEIDLILTPYLKNNNVENKKSSFDTFIYKQKTTILPKRSNYDNYEIPNFLNFYEIKQKLANLSFIEGLAPRWYFKGKASKKDKLKNDLIEFNTNILILDSSLENKIGIGRNLYLPELKMNECYISDTLYNALKANPGDEIQMEVKLLDLIKIITTVDENSKESLEEKIKSSDSINDDDKDNKKNLHKKVKNFNSILNDKEYNINYYNNNNNKNIFKSLEMKDSHKNKNKNKKNPIIDFGPMKKILVNIIDEYINNIIVDFLIKLIRILNMYLRRNYNNDDFSTISIRKGQLLYNFRNVPLVIDLLNELFPSEDNYNKNKINKNEDIFQKTISQLLKKIIIYNRNNDLIYFNQYLLRQATTGNLKRFIEYNIDHDALLYENNIIGENVTQFLKLKLNVTISEKVKSTNGKWPSTFGNVIAIDSKHIKDYLYKNTKIIIDDIVKSTNFKNIDRIIWRTIHDYLKVFDINNYTSTINVIFKDKFEIYKGSVNNIRYYISKITEDIINCLGSNYKVDIYTPIYGVIKGFNIVKIFLQNILYCIMVFLWILSIVLINSLMLGNIDERTYEYGMMRALGFKKDNLFLLIILKGIFFSIPGIIMGLLTSYIANNFISFLFNRYTGLVMPFFLNKINILFGIISGLSIPLISSYLPIKRCLEKNLRETLNFFRNRKTIDIFISMIKLEKMGISPTTFITSITLIIIGLLTYFIAPFSYYQDNLSLFLFIMLCILISMLLGLIILSLLFLPKFQKIIVKLITFISICDRKFNLIILKNLDSHKKRNRQVSMMLITAIGFLIFSGCTLNLIVEFIEEFSQKVIGGDFCIYIIDKNMPNMTLNEISINNYFQTITKNYPNLIKNYSFITFDFKDIMSSYGYNLNTRIGALNGYPSFDINMKGLDKAFIDSSQTFFYNYGEYDTKLNKSYSNGKIDLIKMMYDNKISYLLKGKNITFIHPQNENSKFKKLLNNNFQLKIVAAEGIKKKIGISVDNHAQFKILTLPEHSIPCKIIGFISKLPGSIYISSYESLAKKSNIYITNEQIKQLIDIESEIYNFNVVNLSNVTVDGVRKQKLILKFKENASKELKQMVFFGMNNYLEGKTAISVQILDISVIAERVKKVIEYILLVIGIIVLLLSFFLIWISVSNNIKENIVEYGIMRSIGITKAQNIRIYLYEVATIIMTSILIGTFVGIIISCSLILQFDIFVELPFIFTFPYKFFIILVSVGLFLGLLGSYYPIYNINSYSLVKIIKGFSD